MESWILWVSCKPFGLHFLCKRLEYSWFHEHSKHWINFLNSCGFIFLILIRLYQKPADHDQHCFQKRKQDFEKIICTVHILERIRWFHISLFLLFSGGKLILKYDMVPGFSSDLWPKYEVTRPPDSVRSFKFIFLFHNQNICCGYSKEPSQWQLWTVEHVGVSEHYILTNPCPAGPRFILFFFKQQHCRSRSVGGFWWSHLIRIITVFHSSCKYILITGMLQGLTG